MEGQLNEDGHTDKKDLKGDKVKRYFEVTQIIIAKQKSV